MLPEHIQGGKVLLVDVIHLALLYTLSFLIHYISNVKLLHIYLFKQETQFTSLVDMKNTLMFRLSANCSSTQNNKDIHREVYNLFFYIYTQIYITHTSSFFFFYKISLLFKNAN